MRWLLSRNVCLANMKQEQLQALQPKIFAGFEAALQQGKLGHAYLFSGNFASYDMAIFLSQALFCQETNGVLPCGTCRNCRLITNNEFSDVTVLAPQSNVIKTDTIRELVKNFSQSGFESSQQVFIIRDAEKMHPNAANSLLKVMEEPQSDIRLFLLTNQEEAVLATIKSRTQIINFPKNQPALERMLEEEGLLRTQARLLAQLVSSMDEARNLAQNKSFLDLMTTSRKFVEQLLDKPDAAYLQVGQLTALAGEKAEQARVFDLLALLVAEDLTRKNACQAMEEILAVRRMWQANVSLQNALEYLVLHLARG